MGEQTRTEAATKACCLLRTACHDVGSLQNWQGPGLDKLAVQLATSEALGASVACPEV